VENNMSPAAAVLIRTAFCKIIFESNSFRLFHCKLGAKKLTTLE
jgi:hypothetical protein